MPGIQDKKLALLSKDSRRPLSENFLLPESPEFEDRVYNVGQAQVAFVTHRFREWISLNF